MASVIAVAIFLLVRSFTHLVFVSRKAFTEREPPEVVVKGLGSDPSSIKV